MDGAAMRATLYLEDGQMGAEKHGRIDGPSRTTVRNNKPYA